MTVDTNQAQCPTQSEIESRVRRLAETALQQSRECGDNGEVSYGFAFGMLKSMFIHELRKAAGGGP